MFVTVLSGHAKMQETNEELPPNVSYHDKNGFTFFKLHL